MEIPSNITPSKVNLVSYRIFSLQDKPGHTRRKFKLGQEMASTFSGTLKNHAIGTSQKITRKEYNKKYNN